MPFLITPDERGTVFSANGAYVHLPDDDPIFESVAAELGEFTGRAVEAEKVMKAEALPDHLRGHASKALLSTTRTAVEAARERAREFAVADQRAMTPPKSLDTSNAAEIRAIARSLDRSGKTAFVINATPVELAALMTPGNLANHPMKPWQWPKTARFLNFTSSAVASPDRTPFSPRSPESRPSVSMTMQPDAKAKLPLQDTWPDAIKSRPQRASFSVW